MTSRASRLTVSSPEASRPWWRHGFMWFVFGLPMSAVVAASVSGYVAIRDADKVVPEYATAAKQAAEESITRAEQARVPAELARNHAATPRH